MAYIGYKVMGIDHQGWFCPIASVDQLVSSPKVRGAWDYYAEAKASGLYRHVRIVQEFSHTIVEEELDDPRRVHRVGAEAGTTPEGV